MSLAPSTPATRKRGQAALVDEAVECHGLATLEDALEAARGLYYQGIPIAEAAAAVLASHRLEPDATWQLMQRGLESLLVDEIQRDRGWPEPGPDTEASAREAHRRRFAVVGARKDLVLLDRVLATLYLPGAGRQPKPLADFGTADCEAYMALVGAEAKALGRRLRAMTGIRDLVVRHGAATVAALPPDAMHAAARLAERGWKAATT